MQVQTTTNSPTSRSITGERTALPFPSRPQRIKTGATPVTHTLRGSTLRISKRYQRLHTAAHEANEALYQEELREKGTHLKAAVELGVINESALRFLNEPEPFIRVEELNETLTTVVNTLNASLADKIRSVGMMFNDKYGISPSVTENAFHYVEGGVGYAECEHKLTYVVTGMCEHILYETQILGEHEAVGQALVAELIDKADGAPMGAMMDYASGLFDGLIDSDSEKDRYINLLDIFNTGVTALEDKRLAIDDAPDAQEYFKQFIRGVIDVAQQGKHYDVIEETLCMRCMSQDLCEIMESNEDTEQAAYGFSEIITDGIGLYEIEKASIKKPDLLKQYVENNPDTELASLIDAVMATLKPIDYTLFGDDLHEDNFADTAFVHVPFGESKVIDLNLDTAMNRYHMMLMEVGEGDSNYPIELSAPIMQCIEDRAVNLYMALVVAQFLDDLMPKSTQ